jgi:spermidine synthase/MFS family permease
MRRRYIGLFLLALTTLVVEVLLTKIFDVLLWPNVSFMIISCAMFGIGLGGLFEILWPRATDGSKSNLPHTTLFFSLSIWMLPLLLNIIPFSFDRVGQEPVLQLVCFLLLYLVVLAPFFFGGLSICRLFSQASSDIQRLYFWDLSGAAVGTAILIPLLPPLGPERLLILAAIGALAASALFADTKRWALVVVAIAAAFVVMPRQLGSRYLELALHDNKRDVLASAELGRVEFARWDPVSHIAIVDQPAMKRVAVDRGKKHVAYDGGTQSSNFYPFDGDLQSLRQDLPNRLTYQFWQRGVLASHYLRRDSGHSALIIGSAGGQETKAALMYGASYIDAVEMVGTVVALATHQYADYIGRVFEQPAVHVHVGEGRSFLRASSRKYDVIQIFSNYTSSSAASGSGVLNPVYLQTTEAYVEYFTHLAPDGILQINHHTYPRMIATAAAAWHSLGLCDFRSHVVVFEKAYPEPDHLPTMLIKMSPWTQAEVADLERFFSMRVVNESPYRIVENPFDEAGSFLPAVFYSGDLPRTLVASAPYNISAVTDDKPDFNFLRHSPAYLEPQRATGLNFSTASFLNSQVRRGWLPMDWLPLIVATGASLFYGAIFVLAPMFLSQVGRQQWTGKGPVLLYFSLLGVAFIAIEFLFIQIFMKLIGYPLYAVATVITVMLIGAGLGSISSRAIAGEGSPRWYIAFGGIVATGVAIWLGYPRLSAHFMADPTAVRIVAAAGIIFPMAFFMGMPFPLGILELKTKPAGAVAWAWSMNGLFATIGGVAAVLLALWLGFRDAMLVAIAMYGLAWITFAAVRRGNRTHEVRVMERAPLPRANTLDSPRVAALWNISSSSRPTGS